MSISSASTLPGRRLRVTEGAGRILVASNIANAFHGGLYRRERATAGQQRAGNRRGRRSIWRMGAASGRTAFAAMSRGAARNWDRANGHRAKCCVAICRTLGDIGAEISPCGADGGFSGRP